MPYIPAAEELTKALDNIHYEIQQLAFTTIVPSTEFGLNNAIIESRLLHVRNLLDFFEHSPMREDDVLAAHYGFPVTHVPVEKPYRERLNKDLAHLTYSRTRRSESDKEWAPHQVIVPVLDRCHSFIEYLLATRSSFGSRTKKDGWQVLLLDLTKIRELLNTC